MKTRVATIGVGVMAVLATALPSRSQGPAPKAAPEAAAKANIDPEQLEGRREFLLWRQKARLELAALEAQVEAKKAEIKRVEAEYRMRGLAPTLAILVKLDKRVRFAFPNETPLEDVLKFIKQATAGPSDTGIPIYVDPVGLQEAEKTMSSPVTLDLDGVPLKTCLRLVLKQLGLAYQVKDGMVTITSGQAIDDAGDTDEDTP